MRSLLDINVLIALLDAGHVHHRRASAWLAAESEQGWASCPITQNGCVRVMSQPGYPSPVRPASVMSRLREAARHPSHAFWSDDLSILDQDLIAPTRVLGPRQVTDLYLLALAVAHGGRLVTFDEKISLSAVKGAERANLVIV